jgi:phosphate transport system protein
MSHYEMRLEEDLAEIKRQVRRLVEMTDAAIDSGTRAMLEEDDELASRTIIGDHAINRLSRRIDELCHNFIVRHLPSAGHLRFISSVLRLTVAIERIGDYAVSVSREALLLSKHLPKTVAKDITLMLEQSRDNLSQSASAFLDGDADSARAIRQRTYESRRHFGSLYKDLIMVGTKQSRPPQDLFAFLITFYRLERITDQARNICEETLFAAAGEVKTPKIQRILFADERCDHLAPLAASLAAKAYPESSICAAAGFEPASALSEAAVGYMEAHGLDCEGYAPLPVPSEHDMLLDYDLIIALQGDIRERLDHLPFRTVLLHWRLESHEPEQPIDEAAMERLHGELAGRIHDLMNMLAGEEAC